MYKSHIFAMPQVEEEVAQLSLLLSALDLATVLCCTVQMGQGAEQPLYCPKGEGDT